MREHLRQTLEGGEDERTEIFVAKRATFLANNITGHNHEMTLWIRALNARTNKLENAIEDYANGVIDRDTMIAIAQNEDECLFLGQEQGTSGQ